MIRLCSPHWNHSSFTCRQLAVQLNEIYTHKHTHTCCVHCVNGANISIEKHVNCWWLNKLRSNFIQLLTDNSGSMEWRILPNNAALISKIVYINGQCHFNISFNNCIFSILNVQNFKINTPKTQFKFLAKKNPATNKTDSIPMGNAFIVIYRNYWTHPHLSSVSTFSFDITMFWHTTNTLNVRLFTHSLNILR